MNVDVVKTTPPKVVQKGLFLDPERDVLQAAFPVGRDARLIVADHVAAGEHLVAVIASVKLLIQRWDKGCATVGWALMTSAS